jgi:hypothetical protein
MLNTLPLALHVPNDLDSEEKRVAWLRGIQEQTAVRYRYEHVSLSQVAEWVNGRPPLFNSFLRFQNYPMKQFLASYQGPLRLRNSQVFDQWHYPLSVVVVPGKALVVKVGYDVELFDGKWVGGITAEFVDYLTS